MNQYRYIITNAQLLFSGESTPQDIDPGFISDLYIERDYDNDHFPILRFPITVNASTYYKVLQNKTTTKVRLRIQKYKYEEGKTTNSKFDVVNDVFVFFLDEDTPYMDEDVYKKTQEISKTEGTAHQDYKYQLELYLFKESDILSNKSVLNYVYRGANLTDMIVHNLTVLGTKNVLMCPLDNTGEYTNFIFPPLSFVSMIKFLEEEVGLYRKGTLLYFDLDRVYLVDKGSDCRAWAVQEYKKTTINVAKSLNGESMFLLCEDDSKNKQYVLNVSHTNVNILTDSIQSDQLQGNRYMIVNSSSGDVTRTNTNTTQHGSGAYNVVNLNSNNGFAADILNHSVYEKSKIIQLTTSDFDLNAITPNKEFVFKFEEASINSANGGKYRLSSSKCILKKEGDEYSISADLLFYRG